MRITIVLFFLCASAKRARHCSLCRICIRLCFIFFNFSVHSFNQLKEKKTVETDLFMVFIVFRLGKANYFRIVDTNATYGRSACKRKPKHTVNTTRKSRTLDQMNVKFNIFKCTNTRNRLCRLANNETIST